MRLGDNSDGPRSRYSLIIGDGTLRYVDEGKLEESKVISKDCGSVKDVHEIVGRLPDKYPHMTLVGSEQNCEISDETADQIVGEYNELIRSAKQKASKVTVANICPRTSSEMTQEKNLCHKCWPQCRMQ